MKINEIKVLLLMADFSINQKQLAERAGISRQTLSAVMNGRNCRPKVLGKLAKALEVKPNEIIEL